MTIQWNHPGGRFAFGQLDAQQQSLLENNPSLAFQKLMDYYAQGNPNFANTTLGRYMMQQQDALQNRFTTEQSAQASRIANEKSAWDADQTQQETAYQTQLRTARDALLTAQRTQGGQDFTPLVNNLNTLTNNPFVRGTFKSKEDPLVYTKYLEQNQDSIPGGFGLLTAGMRGASPGAFQVRRNVW